MSNTPNSHSSKIDYILGIQYGDFDDQITASSIYDNNYITSNCKLNGTHSEFLQILIKMDIFR